MERGRRPSTGWGAHDTDWRRVKDILFEALDLPPRQRETFLNGACAGDASLRKEVTDLLQRHLETGGFLTGRAPVDAAAFARAGADGPVVLPEAIAGFRILRLLGHGGMGVVYLAEQERPRREVALKLLRFDRSEASVRLRFEQEAELQGRLQHPGIARVYAAGEAATETGPRLFIAMEWIDGEPLLQRMHSLPGLDARVELVVRVADAIEYAHREGVLHRDIKPENILVDAGGVPKVLDFGVARALDREGAGATLTGQIVGTLAYMSPEQLRGEAASTASDQFSLGVVLFEALTGCLPFEPLRRGQPEVDTSTFARLQRARELPTDLVTVLLKAIEAAPDRRYPSVGAFAADLRRFLRGEPIEARPATALYQLGKLVRRHRTIAAALSTAFLALSLGLVFTLNAMREAQASESRAISGEVRLQQLADEQRVLRLATRAQDLWPIAEETLPALEAWLDDLRQLMGRLPRHEANLARLRGQGWPAVAGEGEPQEDPSRSMSILESTIAGLQALAEPGGLVEEIEARTEFVRGLRARTVEAQREGWAEALRLAADPAGPYAGLRLVPEPGLVPLGPDPVSGLLEFALVSTGDVPRRDGRGRLMLREQTALVLILIPGGSVWIGAQWQDPDGYRFDPYAGHDEGPPRRIDDLDPFMVGKYETTQGQWRRVMGTNPSDWSAGEMHGSVRFTLLHPVESVDRLGALEFCRRVGADLPTEARWEVAARGGTDTPWWFGADRICLSGRDNLSEHAQGLDDGWKLHAPVGTFGANPFGLHDVAGNVSELCLDGFKVDLHRVPLEEGTGRVLVDGGGDWSRRGGSFLTPERAARSAARFTGRVESAQTQTGFRVVREVLLERGT